MIKKNKGIKKLNNVPLTIIKLTLNNDWGFFQSIFSRYGVLRRGKQFSPLIFLNYWKFFRESERSEFLDSCGKKETSDLCLDVFKGNADPTEHIKREYVFLTHQINSPILSKGTTDLASNRMGLNKRHSINTITSIKAFVDRWREGLNGIGDSKGTKNVSLFTGSNMLNQIYEQDKGVSGEEYIPAVNSSLFIHNIRNNTYADYSKVYPAEFRMQSDTGKELNNSSIENQYTNGSNKLSANGWDMVLLKKSLDEKAVGTKENNSTHHEASFKKPILPAKFLEHTKTSVKLKNLLIDSPKANIKVYSDRNQLMIKSQEPVVVLKNIWNLKVKDKTMQSEAYSTNLEKETFTHNANDEFSNDEEERPGKTKYKFGRLNEREYVDLQLEQKLNKSIDKIYEEKSGKLIPTKQMQVLNPITKVKSSMGRVIHRFGSPESMEAEDGSYRDEVLHDRAKLVKHLNLSPNAKKHPGNHIETMEEAGLVYRKSNVNKPIVTETKADPKNLPHEEKYAAKSTYTAPKQNRDVRNIGSKEMNLLAERVFKILEKRIVIQRDRRGLL